MKLAKSNSKTYLGVDYCPTPDDIETPYCPHGPTILFRRFLKNKPSRKFYACAVHRTKRGCPFFQWSDVTIDKKRQLAYLNAYKRNVNKYNWKKLRKQLITFINYTTDASRKLCLTCKILLLTHEVDKHRDHLLQESVTMQQLLHPSRLFLPIRDRSSFAQEFFTVSTLEVITTNISRLNIRRVICVGTPTLHESILSNSSSGLTSFLLDLDPKYSQFLSPRLYQRFNLFNTHFFSPNGAQQLQNFISSPQQTELLIVLDIPFGAKVEAIHSSLQRLWILAGWEKLVLPRGIPTLWIFPYFNGAEIAEKTEFSMLQYRVEYEVKYANKKSPVRIFTNLPLQRFYLPTKSKEYKYCNKCSMFVFGNAEHCVKCNSCVSADGGRSHHCENCDKCVKESFKHCSSCNVCHPPKLCLLPETARHRCHICRELSHKRRNCPLSSMH